MTSTSSKVTLGAATGALVTIIVWILTANHIAVPAEAATAGTVLLTFIAGWFIPETAQTKEKSMINENGDTINGTFDSTPTEQNNTTPEPTPTETPAPETPAPETPETTEADAGVDVVETVTHNANGTITINGTTYTTVQ
jgi:hypothetical protein